MGLRGRKTAIGKVMQLRNMEEMRLPPAPKHLNAAARREWREIVETYPPDRFLRGTWPILENYCVHAVESRRAMARLDALPADTPLRDYDLALRMLERESKLVASFGVRLGIARTSQAGRHNNDPETIAETEDLPWRD